MPIARPVWRAAVIVSTGAAILAATACSGATDVQTSGAPSASASGGATEYPLNTPILVTPENFERAESDKYFTAQNALGRLGKFGHAPEPARIDRQSVIRLNRDTYYSSALFDLDAGPVTITMPDPGDRYMSLAVVNQDEYIPQPVTYKAGKYTFDKKTMGTRYVMASIRTFGDPNNPADVQDVHRLQQAVSVEQASVGKFEVPQWDQPSQDAVRKALLALAATSPDFSKSFGPKDQVDPVRHLISSASAWGGLQEKDAMYLNVTPPQNNGQVTYKLHVDKDVPVDSFWSISVYNAEGYFQPNPQNSYSVNSLTSKKNADGSVDVQFGNCDGAAQNCLVTMPGWNYTVRLYRPHQQVLDGTWKFPQAQPVQ